VVGLLPRHRQLPLAEIDSALLPRVAAIAIADTLQQHFLTTRQCCSSIIRHGGGTNWSCRRRPRAVMEDQQLLKMKGPVEAFLPGVVWKASQCGWLKIGKTDRGLDLWEKPSGERMLVRPDVEPLVPEARSRAQHDARYEVLRQAPDRSIGRSDVREDDGMRMSIKVLAALVALLLPIESKADSVTDPGGGFVGQKAHKLGKNYYVVRKGEGCTIQTGKIGDAPEGAVGNAPYASKNYAKDALKAAPECKGGMVEDDFSKKSKKEND
jgi:hypothetical protein